MVIGWDARWIDGVAINGVHQRDERLSLARQKKADASVFYHVKEQQPD